MVIDENNIVTEYKEDEIELRNKYDDEHLKQMCEVECKAFGFTYKRQIVINRSELGDWFSADYTIYDKNGDDIGTFWREVELKGFLHGIFTALNGKTERFNTPHEYNENFDKLWNEWKEKQKFVS